MYLHGTPGSRVLSSERSQQFNGAGLRVIAPDRAGYGGSDPCNGRSVASNAEDVLTVVDACDVERFLIVGGSGGGPHALAVAAAAPERVQAVGVLVGAAPLTDDERRQMVGFNQQVFDLLEERAGLRRLLEAGRATLLRDGLTGLVADASDADREQWASHADDMARAIQTALEPGIEGWLDDYQALWGRPWDFEPESVSAPVTWLHGADDALVPISAARRLAARLPDCEMTEMADGGHAPPAEMMDRFVRSLLERTEAVAG